MYKNIFNKFKDLLSKYDTYILFAFILLCSIGPILNIKFHISDEIWNFQNVIKLYNGFEIYKEVNLITTPLFFNIAVIMCELLEPTLLTFKIYGIVLTTLMVVLSYKILKALRVSKLNSLLYSLIIYIVAVFVGRYGANYNILVVIFFLLGLLFSIRENVCKPNIYNLLQGIVIFLIFITKQNVAVYYILALIISELLLANNYKVARKSISIKLIISLIFIAVYLLIMYFNGQLYGFINYTILGILEFVYNINLELYALINIIVISIICMITYIYLITKSNLVERNIDVKNNFIKLLIYGICVHLIVYPIFNTYHSVLGAIILYILALYLLDITIVKKIKKKRKYIIYLTIIASVLILIYSIYNLKSYVNYISVDRSEEISVYKNTIIDTNTKKEISKVNKYIEDKESQGIRVVIFSQFAAQYMIPLNMSNGDMDLPFLGNMGANGEKNMLEKIKEMQNTEILIIKDENHMFWQESKFIRDYIIDNFECIGEIGKFQIYQL